MSNGKTLKRRFCTKCWMANVILLVSLTACAGQQSAANDPVNSLDKPYRILISNDDGIQSEGIRHLAIAVAEFADVVVVAPAKNESGASQSTRFFSVRAEAKPVHISESFSAFALNAAPADCVAYGILIFGQDKPFDLVLSGVNKGGNVGSSFLQSGTIGAAFQGLVYGIPSIAVSQHTRREGFAVSIAFAVEVVKSLLTAPMPDDVLLSINVPASDILGVKVLPADLQPYNVKLERMEDESGTFYKPSIHPLEQPHEGYDIESFRQGYITLTPLKLDRNAYDSMDAMKQYTFVKEWSGLRK